MIENYKIFKFCATVIFVFQFNNLYCKIWILRLKKCWTKSRTSRLHFRAKKITFQREIAKKKYSSSLLPLILNWSHYDGIWRNALLYRPVHITLIFYSTFHQTAGTAFITNCFFLNCNHKNLIKYKVLTDFL